MTIRAAYVELNFSHGCIQPTFWWLARQVGIEVDFHLLRANAALEPLALVPGPTSVVPIDVPDPHDPCAGSLGALEFLEPGRYDILILGTAEPSDRPEAVRHLDVPQLHVVHNVARAAPAGPRVTPCVLTPAAGDQFEAPALVIEPFYAGDVVDSPGRRPCVVSVPGNIQLHRRNYGALIRALVALRDEAVTPDDLVVRLVGRAFGREAHLQGQVPCAGEQLLDALRAAGVADFVELFPRELSYPDFYSAIARSHYVLPLIDNFFIHSRPYLHGKYAGSLGVGIGSGAVPILNERHAQVLDIDVGPRYRLDDVAAGLRTALRGENFEGDRAAVKAFRWQRLVASAQRFAGWLEHVT